MKKMGKLASLIIASSITAGGYFFGSCSSNESKSQESEYTKQLANELEFKTEVDFDDKVNFTDIHYNYTILNSGNYKIGLTLDGYYYPKGRVLEDYVIKSEFSVDEKFYNDFKASSKSDITTLYEISSSLIENYTPSKVTVNDKVVYENNKQGKSLTSDYVM